MFFPNILIFISTDHEYHAFVLKLTNVKSSPSKKKYFNALLHDGEAEKSVVSYNPLLFDVIEGARQSDRPVKVTNFIETINEFDNQPLLKLGDRSTVEISTKVLPFEKVRERVQQCNSFSTVDDLADVSVGEMVNLEVYVSISENDVEEINTRFGVKQKLEGHVYDDSCDTPYRITIWNNLIECFKQSGDGVYKIKDLRINSFQGKYLTTTKSTVIINSDKAMRKKSLLPNQIAADQTLSFPAETIDVFEKARYCKRCNRKATPSGKFLICDNCGSRSLLEKTTVRFDVRLTFKKDGSKLSIVIPQPVIDQYVDLLKIDLDDGEENLQVAMLTNEDIKLTYSPTKNVATSVSLN